MWKMIGAAAAAAAMAGLGPATAEEDVALDRIRGYLIYEDTGKLSRNLPGGDDHIVANDENGFSVQMMVDFVVTGPPATQVESNPLLVVWVTESFGEPGAPTLFDGGWPIGFIGSTGEVVRSIVVDHACIPVDVHARLDRPDGTPGEEMVKRFNINCGD